MCVFINTVKQSPMVDPVDGPSRRSSRKCFCYKHSHPGYLFPFLCLCRILFPNHRYSKPTKELLPLSYLYHPVSGDLPGPRPLPPSIPFYLQSTLSLPYFFFGRLSPLDLLVTLDLLTLPSSYSHHQSSR